MKHLRTYVALCQFPGLAPFYFHDGAVTLDVRDGDTREATAAIQAALLKVLPTLPEIIKVVPGRLRLIVEDDEDRKALAEVQRALKDRLS
ncbi:hypothetical protein KQX64_06840 [Rhodopseudomonas palustris]|nr:hypothetical protein KQX64_06840 [Rhodopseudomonas palustris]